VTPGGIPLIRAGRGTSGAASVLSPRKKGALLVPAAEAANRVFPCRVCDSAVIWSGRGRHPHFCSLRCRGAHYRRKYGARYSALHCTIEGCERPRQGRGLCKPHWKQARRAEGYRAPSEAWDARKRDNYHRRRAGGVRNGDPVLIEQVVARDGLHCKWCGLPIDLALRFPDGWSRSLDHVQPLSRGGRHELGNVQLMHFSCNSSKGNRFA
jgi:hypothetical protein